MSGKRDAGKCSAEAAQLVTVITHTYSIYLRKICYVYILNIFIYDIIKKSSIHVNIFQIYAVCVCLYIYITNTHSTHTNYM